MSDFIFLTTALVFGIEDVKDFQPLLSDLFAQDAKRVGNDLAEDGLYPQYEFRDVDEL